MGLDPVTLAFVSTVIAGGSTGYQISSSRRAGKSAKKAGKKQEAAQLALEGELRTEQERTEGLRGRNQARERQRALSVGASGRRSTVLTSPLGVTGEAGGGGYKSLLGT